MAAVSAPKNGSPQRSKESHSASPNWASSASVHPPSGPKARVAEADPATASFNIMSCSISESTILTPLWSPMASLSAKGRNIPRGQATRLLGRLSCQTLPTVPPLSSRGGKMLLGTLGDNRDDPRCSQLSALFNRPFHAIKFED